MRMGMYPRIGFGSVMGSDASGVSTSCRDPLFVV